MVYFIIEFDRFKQGILLIKYLFLPNCSLTTTEIDEYFDSFNNLISSTKL